MGPGQVRLEGLDGVTVLFTDILFDSFFKDDDWIGILLGTTRGAFIRRLEPGEYTLGVEHMLTREAALAPLVHLLKTYDTSLGKVGRAATLLYRRVFALGSARRHRRAPCTHYEIECLKFFREFPQLEHRR